MGDEKTPRFCALSLAVDATLSAWHFEESTSVVVQAPAWLNWPPGEMADLDSYADSWVGNAGWLLLRVHLAK